MGRCTPRYTKVEGLPACLIMSKMSFFHVHLCYSAQTLIISKLKVTMGWECMGAEQQSTTAVQQRRSAAELRPHVVSDAGQQAHQGGMGWFRPCRLAVIQPLT